MAQIGKRERETVHEKPVPPREEPFPEPAEAPPVEAPAEEPVPA